MKPIQQLVDIPRLRKMPPRVRPVFDPKKLYGFSYDIKEHANQPHVVKFSGGRSSGMLLFTLLHNGLLKRERGDVIIFNNTSAEHPATYDFVAKCQRLAEESYGVPFFWTEFQTYEDASGGDWVRMPSYRLVRPIPFSEKNPDGYRYRGEVFEELLSWKRFLPTKFQRICTEHMKIVVTREFLADWFAMKPSLDRRGHYYKRSMMTDDAVLRLHRKYKGETPSDILLAKTAFVRSRPWFRPEQNYADFSGAYAALRSKALEGKAVGERVALSGDNSVDYVAFIGFRGDEPHRVARMKARNYEEEECPNDSDPHLAAPEGEYAYAPLATMNVGREAVNAFWKKQKWDLRLPHNVNFSNCVYCFLKGSKTLADIETSRVRVEKRLPKSLQAQPNTPADVNWWASIENKYGRDIEKEGRNVENRETAGEKPFIGFWGINGRMSFSRLANASKEENAPAVLAKIRTEESALPCDCTD